jgi:hypothetical protein
MYAWHSRSGYRCYPYQVKRGIFMRRSLLWFCLLALVACGGSQRGSPIPAPYPNATNVSQQRFNGGDMRVTTFKTTDSPQIVFDFYRRDLLAKGWELLEEQLDGYEFVYAPTSSSRGTETGPAFGLTITTHVTQEGATEVKLDQRISGPFHWADP